MVEFNILKIGSKVNIATLMIKDKVSDKIIDEINLDPVGKIIDYKLNDGKEIGYIIEFKNGSKLWFFNNEIDSEDKLDLSNDLNEDSSILSQAINISKEKIQRLTSEVTLNGDKSIILTTSPYNFIKWLLYVTSDIF